MGGFGRSRPLFGVQFEGFCEYFGSSGNFVQKKHTKRKAGDSQQSIFVVFGKVQKKGVNEGGGVQIRGGFVVVLL